MDVPAPLGGVVQEIKVKVGDKVSRRRTHPDARHRRRGGGRRQPTARRGAAPQRPPPARDGRGNAAATAGAIDESAFRARLRRARRAQARARARRRPRQGQGQRRQGPHPAGRRRGLREGRRRCSHGRGRSGRRRAASDIDLLPWPKVDFTKFGPIESRSRCRASRRSPAPTCIATG